jgi:hypothetical protein
MSNQIIGFSNEVSEVILFLMFYSKKYLNMQVNVINKHLALTSTLMRSIRTGTLQNLATFTSLTLTALYLQRSKLKPQFGR